MQPKKPQGPSLLGLLKPYNKLILLLVVLTIFANSLNLVVPKLIGHAVDNYTPSLIAEFFVIAAGIFIL